MGNLAGWPYWKVISITGQSGAGTDYQVKFEIGDSAGGNVHLEGNCINFPQDIQITDDDGTTLLDYWIEDITTDPIVVHVEVKDDLGSNRDIRVYYGKSGETTASDIEATMIFGDEFNGANGSLDTTNRWTRVDGTTMGADGSGSLYLYGASGTRDKIRAKTACPFPCIVEARYKKENVITLGGQHFIGIEDSTVVDFLTMSTGPTSVSNVYLYRSDGGSLSSPVDVLQDTVINFNKYKLEFYTGPVAKWYQNDVLFNTYSDANVPDGDNTMYVYVREAGQNEDGWIDWVFVRKYNSPEPAFSSAGAEQSPTGVSPTGVFYGPLVGPFGGPI